MRLILLGIVSNEELICMASSFLRWGVGQGAVLVPLAMAADSREGMPT